MFSSLLAILAVSYVVAAPNSGCDVADDSAVVPILATDEAGASLVPCDSGLKFLRSLGDLPLYTTVVAGPARTGKSFMINQLLEQDNAAGFSVGHSPKGHTKGCVQRERGRVRVRHLSPLTEHTSSQNVGQPCL